MPRFETSRVAAGRNSFQALVPGLMAFGKAAAQALRSIQPVAFLTLEEVLAFAESQPLGFCVDAIDGPAKFVGQDTGNFAGIPPTQHLFFGMCPGAPLWCGRPATKALPGTVIGGLC
ncbi:hypothetical protein AR540_18125 [Pseudomonas sp. EpS/L25]|nr:hypothetical protein AR540_18125 [Pseudomonas sp. EpS/L25]